MRRIDLACKLIAPLCISLVAGHSTRAAIWFVFAQNVISVAIECLAIAKIFSVVSEPGQKTVATESRGASQDLEVAENPRSSLATADPERWYHVNIRRFLAPWQSYICNPDSLASFSLSLLYLTVLSFNSQMMTYLLTVGSNSVHISVMWLLAVLLELVATFAAPIHMRQKGGVRSSLWLVDKQPVSLALAVGLYSTLDTQTKLAGGILVTVVSLSRISLFSFDLCVPYLVHEVAPGESFPAIEAALQNSFKLLSCGTTIISTQPADFEIPAYISTVAVAVGAAVFVFLVRKRRGALGAYFPVFQARG